MMLDKYLQLAQPGKLTPKAIISPHAGYIYSGAIAANAYSLLSPLRNKIKRVLLLGPAHRVYVKGMALPSHSHFATPLGNISLDVDAFNQLERLPFVERNDAAHAEEHSLETQLPFLQKTLNDFLLIPVLVGDAKPEDIETVIQQFCQSKDVMLVVSSDLSHFHDYDTAKRIDADTTRLIECFDFQHIGPKQACGCRPMNGLLKYARNNKLSIKTLDTKNSGDTAGNKDRVVGYGAYALFEPMILHAENKTQVLAIIRKSIEHGIKTGEKLVPKLDDYSSPLTDDYAVFVTLKIGGKLRGCIGTTEAQQPLILAAANYAFAAAFSDPRFPPVNADEFPKLEISLSILTPAQAMQFDDEADLLRQLRPNIDGLIISKGHRRATFLPIVWESLPKPKKFLTELKHKAGIASNEVTDEAWHYTAEYYS